MSLDTLPTWVIAVATVAYTVGTFLLWRATQRSLSAMRDAFRLNCLMAIHQIKSEVPGFAKGRMEVLDAMAKKDLKDQFLQLLKKNFPNDFEPLSGQGD